MNPLLADSYKSILQSAKDMTLVSQILTITSEEYFLQLLPIADVDGVHAVSEFVKLQLAIQLKQEWLACYNLYSSDVPYNVNASEIGKRKLKNLCLSYLMLLNENDIYDLCLNQYNNANNMTDELASLVAIANSNFSDREQLLEQFFVKWQAYPLVVDKLVAINAGIKNQTLERVKKLTKHPAFDITNPNKVSSLIGIFTKYNHINFHRLDECRI